MYSEDEDSGVESDNSNYSNGFEETAFCNTSCFCVVDDEYQESKKEPSISFGQALINTITCKLCEEKKYQFLLECGHHYCETCIVRNTKSQKREVKKGKKMKTIEEEKLTFTCPECNAEHDQNFHDQESRIKHKVVNDILDVLTSNDMCSKHPYWRLPQKGDDPVQCIPCNKTGLCALCYSEFHLGCHKYSSIEDKPVRKTLLSVYIYLFAPFDFLI
jgi:hypothetical protein